MSKNAVAAAVADENENNAAEQLEMKPKKMPFALWEVGGKTYKLKLKTSATCELEQKYGRNLLSLMGEDEGGMPALVVMLDIAYVAAKDWNHGLRKSQMTDLYDQWIEEGGSLIKFYTDIYMNIFFASGFFTETQAAAMMEMADDLGS